MADSLSLSVTTISPWAKAVRHLEEELHNLLGRGPSSKGGDGGYGGKNRKGKATGKGQPDDGGKNRGGDHRPKDDGRPSGKK